MHQCVRHCHTGFVRVPCIICDTCIGSPTEAAIDRALVVNFMITIPAVIPHQMKCLKFERHGRILRDGAIVGKAYIIAPRIAIVR